MISSIEQHHPYELEIDLGLLTYQVSELLAQHSSSMLQFSPDQIRGFVISGRGILLADPQNQTQLAAFAKLYEWPGHTEENRRLFELGSWIVPQKQRGKGYGEEVLMQTVKRGKQIDPNCQIIAVAEHTNHASQGLMIKKGGIVLPREQWPSNLEIVLQDGTANVVVIDLTNVIAS